ncbi:MAG: glycosyltransferase family 39 protein [Candidatus Methanomethylophilaceae archaeon]|nr:glycosyltransferase family 39 protein [Candidatus Methanomethylophilaceae archaeon]
MADDDCSRPSFALVGKKGLVITIILGLIIRMIIAPFLTYDFDIYHWGVILENIQSGNGLYELAGFYYTPVWGYIMGFESEILRFFDSLSAYGFRYEELLPVESFNYRFHTATVTTLAFDFAMKIPLFIVDAITAGLVYILIKDICSDEKKACIGAFIWMMAPLVIYMTAVQAMFDSISAMLMILIIILLRKDYRFIAGAVFAIAALLKLFPVFTIFVLLFYVIFKGRINGTVKRDVLLTISGAVIAGMIIYIPQILDGTFMDSLSFIFARASEEVTMLQKLGSFFNYAVCIFGMLFFSYNMYKRHDDDLDKSMLFNALGALICAVCISTTPQYVIVALPLLIVYGVTYTPVLKKAAILIVIGGFFAAIAANTFPILSGAAVNLSLVNVQFILDGLSWLETTTIFGTPIRDIIGLITTIIQYSGVIVALIVLLTPTLKRISPFLDKHLPEVEL